MHPLEIREARQKDLTGIVPFVMDAISETYYREGLSQQERQSHEDLARTAPACLVQAMQRHDQKAFVAHVAEELAGFVVLIDLDTEVPELDWFIVARKFQGTDVAQALMDIALAAIPEYSRVRLGVIHYNTRAQAFYRKNGFRDTGRITGNYLIPRILMIRDTTSVA